MSATAFQRQRREQELAKAKSSKQAEKPAEEETAEQPAATKKPRGKRK